MAHPIDDFNREFGARIRRARQYSGLSQAQVAQALGIPRPSVTLIEAGTRNVTARELVSLSTVLCVRAEALLYAGPPVELSLPAKLRRAYDALNERDQAELRRFAEWLRDRPADGTGRR